LYNKSAIIITNLFRTRLLRCSVIAYAHFHLDTKVNERKKQQNGYIISSVIFQHD